MKNSDPESEVDFLDILFKDRNKLYGAYPLRKQYSERLFKAICFAIGLMALLLAAMIYQSKIKKPKGKLFDTRVYVFSPVKIEPPKEKKSSAKSDKKPENKKLEIEKKNSDEGKIVMTKSAMPPKKETIQTTAGLPGSGLDIPGEMSGPSLQGADLPGLQSVPFTSPTFSPQTPLATAEKMPQFPGGKKALLKFLQKNLHSPEPIDEDKMIKVRIQFVVGYDGKLKSFEVLEDGGEAFNQEVIRVLKKMPDWIPGATAGKNVSVYYSLPVSFIPNE